MLILLPPSEGKSDATDGPPLDIAGLSMPELTKARLHVSKALVKVCDGRVRRARTVLGLSERQDAEIERDRQLFTAPTAPAADIYSGVAYQALAYRTLSSAARRRLDQWALVTSSLWGAIRLTDHIPAYRLSADVALPRIGPVAGYWRKQLPPAMTAAAGPSRIVLDLRSSPYVKMWTPSGGLVERTAAARILQRKADGTTKVVSHHNKATKGRLVRAIAQQASTPQSTGDLLDLIGSLGYDVESTSSSPESQCASTSSSTTCEHYRR